MTKAAVVGAPTGLWLLLGAAGVASALALVAAAALVALAWVRLEMGLSRRAAIAPRPAYDAVAAQRIDRTPTGRSARNVRCPATRATARARRSTRR